MDKGPEDRGEIDYELDETFCSNPNNFDTIWQGLKRLIIKNTGGKILYAGALGSRLYNLNLPNSDLDMFLVYQLSYKSYLQLKSPILWFKNKDNMSPDFTVFELYSFANLLLQSDSRSIESLFTAAAIGQNPAESNPIEEVSEKFSQYFVQNRKSFFSLNIVNKYFSEYTGVKGIKKQKTMIANLQDSSEDGSNEKEALQARINKGWYILHRLLFQIRQILAKNNVEVEDTAAQGNLQIFSPLTDKKNYLDKADFYCYLTDENPVRSVLLSIRAGTFPATAQQHILFCDKEANFLQGSFQRAIGKPQGIGSELLDKYLIKMRLSEMVEDLKLPKEIIKQNIQIFKNYPERKLPENLASIPGFPGNFPMGQIKGQLLALKQWNNRYYGVYLCDTVLKFGLKDHFPQVINHGNISVTELDRFFFQIDKGNPNDFEFLFAEYFFDVTFSWESDAWKTFIHENLVRFIGYPTMRGCYLAIEQAGKKLRKIKVSKRHWKKNKEDVLKEDPVVFDEDLVPYTKLMRFLYQYSLTDSIDQDNFSLILANFNGQDISFPALIENIQATKESWEAIFPKRLFVGNFYGPLCAWILELRSSLGLNSDKNNK